jgi:hypothetical protein
MTVDIYQSISSRERVTAGPVGSTIASSSKYGGGSSSSSASTGRVPLQSRNPNTIVGSSSSSHGVGIGGGSYHKNNNSSTEEYNSKDMASFNRLSNLESSHNENNKRLTNSSSYANNNNSNSTHRFRRAESANELREGSEPGVIPTVPRPNVAKRSNSLPTNTDLNDDSVIIEEKRRQVNGDGYTIHRYLRGRLLGKGGFAKVYLCTALDTNKAYAIKIVPKANLVKARARQKVSAMKVSSTTTTII